MGRERRVRGRRVDDFPPRRRTLWDFGQVADGHVYLLRRGRDFDVAVESLAIAARRWAREHRLPAHDAQRVRRAPGRPRQVGLYVRFEREARGRKRSSGG